MKCLDMFAQFPHRIYIDTCLDDLAVDAISIFLIQIGEDRHTAEGRLDGLNLIHAVSGKEVARIDEQNAARPLCCLFGALWIMNMRNLRLRHLRYVDGFPLQPR